MGTHGGMPLDTIVRPTVQNDHSCNHSDQMLERLQEQLFKMIVLVIV